MLSADPHREELSKALQAQGYTVDFVHGNCTPVSVSRHVVAARGGKTYFEQKPGKAVGCLEDGLRTWRGALRRLGHQPTKLLVVTHKSTRTRWDKDTLAITRLRKIGVEVEVRHYGDLRGLNDWCGWDTLTIGDPCPPPASVAARANLYRSTPPTCSITWSRRNSHKPTGGDGHSIIRRLSRSTSARWLRPVGRWSTPT